jgi:hypothetical protein
MLYASDGSAYTGGSPTTRVLCYVSKDGAARSLGGGTSPSGECFHVGGGQFVYFPTATETNGDHVTFQFETNNAEAIPVVLNVYPRILTEAEEEKLQRGVQALVTGSVQSGASTTSIPTSLTETTADHYNGRTITFTSGAMAGQSSDITDYSAQGVLTVTALTETPEPGVEFVIS